jgi:3,4-dihydroxy 2-butanone 4-phosphate synthase / GTP cyclohydrolase II
VSSLAETAGRFATGEPALVCGASGSAAVVAIAAARASAPSLEQLYDLGGDMAVLGLEPEDARRLGLAELAGVTRSRHGLVAATPVDAADRVGGWSFAGRAHTIRVAADPCSGPQDLTAPGHVHPAWIDDRSCGGAALALELARAAGQPAAVVLSAVLDRGGRPVTLRDARRDPGLRALPVAPGEVLRGLAIERELARTAVSCSLPTRLGSFRAAGHAITPDGDVAIALIHGDPRSRPSPRVHAHVACLLGDTFSSLLCGCHDELKRESDAIVADGAGVILYIKPAPADPFACPHGRTVDPSLTLALLRHAGLSPDRVPA